MIENGSLEAKGLRKRSRVLVAGLERCFVRLELTDGNLLGKYSFHLIYFIRNISCAVVCSCLTVFSNYYKALGLVNNEHCLQHRSCLILMKMFLSIFHC